MSNEDEILDFTPEPRAKKFKINGEIYVPRVDIPANIGMRVHGKFNKFAKNSNEIPVDERVDAMKEIFHLTLAPESAKRFLSHVDDDTIGLNTITKVANWLMEQFGERPTMPSGESSNTFENSPDGMSLTDVAQSME